MMVKICGVTTVEDALMAAEAGAGAVGLNFYSKSPRYITEERALAIIATLPGSILKVGVVVDQIPACASSLDVLQIHGTLAARHSHIWRAHSVTPAFSPAQLEGAEAYLLDTPSATLAGGTGQTFDWSRALIPGKRIILAGGLDASNVRQAIESAQPWGVDACSRLESAPGRKDAAKVRDFITAAHQAAEIQKLPV